MGYKLEPKGFWISDSLLREINEDCGEIEKRLLKSLKNLPKTAHRAKASRYRKLGYFYMDTGEDEKALNHLKKSLELDSKQLGKANDVRETIQEIEVSRGQAPAIDKD